MKLVASEPRKLPTIARARDHEKVAATPSVITFAMQCWNPQKINSGIPKIMPSGVPFLYILTARYMITPQRTDFIKKANENSQVATLFDAASTMEGSATENKRPIR